MRCFCSLFELAQRRTGLLPVAAVGFLVLFFFPVSAFAASPPVLTADSITYDESTGVTKAQGHVELSDGEYVLRADAVTYDKNTDVAHAEGNVAVLSRTNGVVLNAQEMEVSADLKEGFLGQIGLLFPDNARLAAAYARRYEGRYLVATRGVYSSCDHCEANPRKAPLWQIKAERVTHDAEKKDIIYRNAYIDFWGVPIFYTPYFSHPDPTVVRRRGFLFPVIGADNTLGPMAKIPYYFYLTPSSDFLVTPTFSREDGLQLALAWRQKFARGKVSMEGSGVNANYTDDQGILHGKSLRGHIFGDGIFALNKDWRLGGEIAYTSDKGYLNRYHIPTSDLLVNRLYAEYFKGRNYGVSDLYYFEDMRPGTRPVEPLVAPEVRYSALGEPGGTLGGRWSWDASMLVTTRRNTLDPAKRGPSTRRLSTNAGWQRQMVSQTGFLTTVSALARADAYWADDVERSDGTFDKVERIRPFVQGDISVRYPLGRHGKGYEQILEPIAVLSVAPRVDNSVLLPNEDSLDADFDETNLFSPNRFSGLDKIEGGTRVAYGVRQALYGHDGGQIELIAGQVFRFKEDKSFSQGSGLRGRLSDYVGRLRFIPADWIDISYGFRLEADDLELSRQELQASVGTPVFKPYINYLSLRQSEGSSTVNQHVEEGTAGLQSSFAKHWSISGYHKRAISPMPGPRKTGASVGYKDECFSADLSFVRDYTDQVDVDPGLTVFLKFNLRTLGGVDLSY